MARRPDFLIIGAQKAGTTWLLDNLIEHPEIFAPKLEIHYFSKEEHYRKGESWYLKHFESALPEQVIGEKTPEYLNLHFTGNGKTSVETHRRIYAMNPRVKLICILRNPMNRALSAVHHMLRTGRISPFTTLDDIFLGSHRHLCDRYGFLSGGQYASSLKKYLELFPDAQLKILFYETDVKASPEKALQRVCRFLNIDPNIRFQAAKQKKNVYRHSRPALILNYYFPTFRALNNRLNHVFTPYKPKPSPAVLQFLTAYTQREIIQLRELKISPPDQWLKKPE